jgi:hypothetical protein
MDENIMNIEEQINFNSSLPYRRSTGTSVPNSSLLTPHSSLSQ